MICFIANINNLQIKEHKTRFKMPVESLITTINSSHNTPAGLDMGKPGFTYISCKEFQIISGSIQQMRIQIWVFNYSANELI